MSPPGFESGKSKINSRHYLSAQIEPELKSLEDQLRTVEKGLSDQAKSLRAEGSKGQNIDIENSLSFGSSPQRPSYKNILLHSNSESPKSTPESLVKLAKEALQVGELLGARVTGSVEAAISRITTPLKQVRKQNKKIRRSEQI